MRPFAIALLLGQTLAVSVGVQDETLDDYVLDCLTDMAGLPDPDFCTPLEAVRADFEGKIETIRNNFNTHVADDAIHSSSTSDDLVVVDSDSSSSSSSHSHSHSHSSYRYSFSYDSHSFGLSSDYSFLSSDYSYHFLHDSHSSHSDHHYRPRRKSYAPIRRPKKTVYHSHGHQHTVKQPAPTYKQFNYKYGFKPTTTSYTHPTPAATTHHGQYYSEADLVGYITFLESKVKQITGSVGHGY